MTKWTILTKIKKHTIILEISMLLTQNIDVAAQLTATLPLLARGSQNTLHNWPVCENTCWLFRFCVFLRVLPTVSTQ